MIINTNLTKYLTKFGYQIYIEYKHLIKFLYLWLHIGNYV
jgi:hypothetical protein